VIENEKVLLMAHTSSISGCDTVWYLNTGDNNHMTGHKYLFAEMTELARTVSFGDATKVEVKGKGSVKFLRRMRNSDGRKYLLHFRDKEQHSERMPTDGK
jgi:calcineurin-like phosphoesterase family protein